MKIDVKVDKNLFRNLSDKSREAYLAELQTRVHEIYPESHLTVIPGLNDKTEIATSDFFNDIEAKVTVQEIVDDVSQHGYWRNQG
ncbi:penicillin-binding protein [Serratia sp. L9]|uniref:penicillin-binding protein n=1 Tax=Serratia sp. L9 TaxID=3423946 RepID=UPI003D667A3B